MKLYLSTLFFLILCYSGFSQVTYTANDTVPEYTGFFRPGVNPGNYFNWTDEQVANLAAGNPYRGLPGIGAKTIRPSLPEVFLDVFGYDVRLGAFQHNKNLGMEENVCFIGYPNLSHRDTTEYCPNQISELFSNMYLPIWDGGANGTPYNDDNYLAAYTYEVVTRYKDYVRFWEIWNEPSLDRSNYRATLPPGHPESWWDNDPEPCDMAILAPVYHYIRMLRVCYDVIKTVDPDAYVSLGGVGYYSFFDVLCRNTDNPVDGSVTPDYPLTGGAYFDAVGIHTYPHFDGSTIFLNNGQLVYERHSDAAAEGIATAKNTRQDIMGGYGYDGITFPKKEFIITEINVPRLPFENFMGSEESQRNFMAKALVMSMSNDIHQLHIYNLGDLEDEPNAESYFDVMGLYGNLNNTPPYTQERTQAGIAYKTASDMLYETRWDSTRSANLNLPPEVRGGALKNDDGEYVYVLWARTEIDSSEEGQAMYSFPTSLNITELYKKEWDYEVTEIETLVSTQNILLNTTPTFFTDTPFDVDTTDLTIDDCVETIDGFDYLGQYLGHKYFRSNSSLVWEDAKAFCEDKGGYLVEVNDYAENQFLLDQLSEPVFIGLNDANTEGTLMWANDEPLTFNNIDVCNFCEENTTTNDYLMMHSWNGKWSFVNGTIAKKFLLEIPCESYTPPNPGSGNDCEDPVPGFTSIGELGGKQYFISNGANTWDDAKLLCEAQDGDLVVIDDVAENLFIKNQINEMVFIGLSDAAVEGDLQWVDDSVNGYENFQICNFCQGNDTLHDYVIMHQWDGGWSFQAEGQSRRYIMERLCIPDTTNTGGPGCSDLLSLNKPTDQSSVQFNASAARAVDGNTAGDFWVDNSTTLTNWEYQPWIEVDLEEVKQIDEIEIWNRTDCCASFLSNYYVLVSNVPFTSNDLSTNILQTGVGNYFEVDPALTPTTIPIDRTGRYVRLQLTGTSYLAVTELKVFGCDVIGGCPPAGTICDDGDPTTENDVEDGFCNCVGTPIIPAGCNSTTNLALNQPTEQSSTIVAGGISGRSSKAVDGDKTGIFFTNPTSASSVSATTKENEAWWQVDLGAVYLIEKINFYNKTDGNDRTQDCHVMISNTPFTSNSLSDAQAQSDYDEMIVGLVGSPSTLLPNTTGRYVRIQLAGLGYMTIAELEVIGCTLPVNFAYSDLMSFSVMKNGWTSEIDWMMRKETDVDYYEIERSIDGNVFELLENHQVTSASTPSHYRVIDRSPFVGENFYRLKVIQKDGSFYYSDTRRVNFDIDFDEVHIYPNPTENVINVSMRDFAGRKGTVEIFSSLGEKVMVRNYESIPTVPATFDVSHLASGIYMMSIKVDVHRRFTKKFIVERM